MEKLNYRLIAKNSPKNECFAENDEPLKVAPVIKWPNEIKEHYFIGVETGRRSKIAFVQIIHNKEDVIDKSYSEYYSPLSNLYNIDTIDKFGDMLLSLPSRYIEDGKPVSSIFVYRGIPPRVHLALLPIILKVVY